MMRKCRWLKCGKSCLPHQLILEAIKAIHTSSIFSAHMHVLMHYSMPCLPVMPYTMPCLTLCMLNAMFNALLFLMHYLTRLNALFHTCSMPCLMPYTRPCLTLCSMQSLMHYSMPCLCSVQCHLECITRCHV